MARPIPLAAALALACAAAPSVARADCDAMTRPIAARLASALRARAPAWARPLVGAAQLYRFERTSFRPLTYFLGYGALSVERLGVRGAPPFQATVVVRCRDGRAAVVDDPYAWANARARELRVQLASAEQAAGYAAEVVALGVGRRPDAANGSRQQAGIYRVDVSLAPRQGDPAGAPQVLRLEVLRDGTITRQ